MGSCVIFRTLTPIFERSGGCNNGHGGTNYLLAMRRLCWKLAQGKCTIFQLYIRETKWERITLGRSQKRQWSKNVTGGKSLSRGWAWYGVPHSRSILGTKKGNQTSIKHHRLARPRVSFVPNGNDLRNLTRK